MAAKPIEAALRIALQVSEAITGLKQFRAELQGAKADAAKLAGAGAAAPAAKADTDAAVAQVKRRSQAEREAAAEAKRLAKERSDAARAAAAEETRRQRTADNERRRTERAAADSAAKAARDQKYRAAALAPQLNDVFVGLTTGQSPVQVALQQGTQITQIYGGLGNTFRALMSVLTPARLLLGGLATTLLAVAAGAAAGDRESSQLRKTLALTGNAAGTSLGRIDALAKGIAAEQRASVGFVRELLAGLLTVAGQTDATMGATARAASALSKLTGQTSDEVLKGFEDQAAGITQWAVKANKGYNFLTAEQVRYIRSLEQQGRVAEAIKFTNEQLADSLTSRGQPAIGAIERAWNAATRALSGFWDQLKALGRDSTAEERLAKLQEKLREIDARLAQGRSAGRRKSTDLADRAAAEAEIAQINRDKVRQAEATARQREEQDRIFKLSKEYQDLLAQNRSADAQKLLAQRERELDEQRALIEADFAKQVESAASRDLKLNAIEQERAREREALAAAELASERKRQEAFNTLQEKEGGKAAIATLEARLIEAKARFAAAVSEGSRLIDAEIARLNEDIQARAAENAKADIPKTTTDPAERARLTAMAETDQLRKELRDLQRDLVAARAQLGESPLVARLQAQVDQAQQQLTEATRRSELQTLLQQAAEQLQAIALAEQRLDQLVQQSAITEEEAERRKLKLRQDNLAVLQQIEALVKKRALTPEEQNSAAGLTSNVRELTDASTELERTLRGSLKNEFADLFKSVETGSSSALEAVKKFIRGVASSMLDLINRRLADQLVNALFGANTGTAGAGGGLGSFLGSIFGQVKHSGGVIGSSGLARAVSPLVFAGAQILHSGGLVGLRANEVPVIAEKGEEMLTADNPRHINNFKGFGGMNVGLSVTFNNAAGSEQDQRATAADLQRAFTAFIEDWAARQQRQGGILAGARRG